MTGTGMSENPTDRVVPTDDTMTTAAPTSEAPVHDERPPAGESPVPDASAAPESVPSPESAETAEAPEGVQEAAPPAPPVPVLVTHRARVTRVTAEEVLAEIDGRQGSVPIIEFIGQPLPKEGDEFSVIIERDDPETGQLLLSKRQADEQTFWDSVKPGEILEGVVTGMNKGGLDIDIGGARAFLPASQVDTHRLRDISTFIGEHVRCVVTQVDRTTRDLIVSRRKLIDRERKARRTELLKSLQEGEVRTGTVSNIMDYGAFVDLGGVDGLLHITDMSWARLKHPSEMVQVGQELQVRVLKVDRSGGKVSLGLKQIAPDPWEGVETRYPEGSRLRARVVRLADFGAFLELEPGVDALLPASEISWSRRTAPLSELVHVGDEPEVVVLKVDPARKRISVGMKQIEENPWTSAETRFAVDTVHRGKVSKIVDYGAFVEVAPGIEGLVHISELSNQRVRSVGDVVKEGQDVEVRVVKLDLKAQRISLSMRPKPEPMRHVEESAKRKTARKRPLRGGLASHFEW